MALTETAGPTWGTSTSNTSTSSSYTPVSSSLQVVIAGIGNGNNASSTGISVSDSAGGTWRQIGVKVLTTGPMAAIFCKDAGASPPSQTITVTGASSSVDGTLPVCRQYSGAAASASQTATPVQAGAASTQGYTQAITPGTTGSQVVGAYAQSSNGVTLTNNAATVMPTGYGTFKNGTNDTTAVFEASALSTSGTPITLGFTNVGTASAVFVLVEILPASGTTHSGTSTLSGSGTLTGAGVFAASAALSGSGTLTWSGSRIFKATILTGSGTLTGSRTGTRQVAITLTGSGTLSGTGTAAIFGVAALSGSGSLAPVVTLGFSGVLSGIGTLNLRSTGQAVFASPGTATPYAYPGSSQVSVAPQGSANWQYLGQLGVLTALKYSFSFPGGCDKMSATVMVPADYRTQLFDPGSQVRITRGGHQVWSGKLDEPVATRQGWNLTAVGDGNRGADFLAVYTATWPSSQPDQSINNAISRGLPWKNRGVGSPAGAWFGQAVDSAGQTIKALLDLICTRGGLSWYVNSQPGGSPGSDLAVFPLPTVPNRIIVSSTPVARTLGGDINTIFIRYQVTSSSAAGSTATFAVTSVQNAASAQKHGVIETFIDLSNAGTMSAGAAQAVGNSVLSVYQRASFAGPFTVSYGQLLSTGGQPIDPGTDQAGTMARLVLTDYGYGGEVTPQFPVTFPVGAYEWDDFSQVATVTPYQNVDQSLTGLLSIRSTTLTPITVA